MKPPSRFTPSWGVFITIDYHCPIKTWGSFYSHYFCFFTPCILHGRRFILLFSTLIFLLPLCVLCEGGFSYFLFFCCLCPAPWHFAWAEFHSLFYQFVAPLPRILYKMQGWLYYYVFLKKCCSSYSLYQIWLSNYLYLFLHVINCQCKKFDDGVEKKKAYQSRFHKLFARLQNHVNISYST